MNSINSVEQLAEILDEIDPDCYSGVMKRINISSKDLDHFTSWSPNDYTRNCLKRTENYEVILLCWDTNSETPIHGHGGEECWVYQVKGTVEEIRYKKDGTELTESCRMQLSPGDLTYMNDQMGFHSIKNLSKHRALTLHIYISPIDKCRVYNQGQGRFEVVEMSYDTYPEAQMASPAS